MAHLVTDRIVAGLRWIAIALYLLGVLVILGAMAFTQSVDALVNAVLIVALSFAAPATAILLFAFWLDSEATNVEDDVRAAAVPDLTDSRRPFREPLRKYVVAVIAVLLAWGARTLLDPVIPSTMPFITFFLAVGAAGWLGGFGPAMLATALSTLVSWYFFTPALNSFRLSQLSDAVGLGLFIFMALAIGTITAALHNALLRITDLKARLAAASRQVPS